MEILLVSSPLNVSSNYEKLIPVCIFVHHQRIGLLITEHFIFKMPVQGKLLFNWGWKCIVQIIDFAVFRYLNFRLFSENRTNGHDDFIDRDYRLQSSYCRNSFSINSMPLSPLQVISNIIPAKWS